jgi:hypothetical protein
MRDIVIVLVQAKKLNVHLLEVPLERFHRVNVARVVMECVEILKILWYALKTVLRDAATVYVTQVKML